MKPVLVVLLMLSIAGGAVANDDLHIGPSPQMIPLSATALDSIQPASKVARGNLVGVTITNYGFIGNNFISRDPSLEYPLGAGFEHMVRGGLWVGAQATDDNGPFTGVVTATVDGTQSQVSQGATEFTPAGRVITARSTLKKNEFFSREAISELDFVSEYSDQPAKNSDNNGERHRPMNIKVHQENYAWSFSEFAHSNFFHFQIINNGPPLQNVWVGIYSELASGCKACYSSWAPASEVNAGGGWYKKKWIAVDDTLTLRSQDTVRVIPPMFREHYCNALPTPINCNIARAPYWMGIKLLGTHNSRADTVLVKRVTIQAWGFAPLSPLRDQDSERYAIISSGTIIPIVADELQPSTGDPVELIAVGPFSQIDPGDTISADFAFVGGAEISDIQSHARFAQRAFDRDYIVPVPPPSPGLKVVARHNGLDLYWDNEPESFVDITSPLPADFEGYRVYIGEDRLDLHRVGQFDLKSSPHDTTGFNTGLNPVAADTTIDGVHYDYRYSIDHLRDGFKYFVAVTSYDIGNVEIESLESGISQNKSLGIPAPAPGERVHGDEITVFPNPYRVEARWDQKQKVREHYLWFANLPQRATIKIFTLSGDLVYATDFDGDTYHGASARGVYYPPTNQDIEPPTLSKRMFAWDLITRGGQAAATGLYMYSVEDKASGTRHRGKFLIVKSDREEF